MTFKVYQVVLGLVAAVVTTVAWFLLAPPMLGGSTSYAIIRGTSMAPQFRSGDLVLIRGTSDYHIGEITAYRNHDFNRIVLHRILRRDGNHFLFKGDNNNYVDSAQPTKADLVGRLWLRLPGFGAQLAWIRTPLHLLPLALVALLAVAFRWSSRRRRVPGGIRTSENPSRDVLSANTTTVSEAVGGGRRVPAALCATAALCGLAFVVTFILPTSQGARARSYEELNTFTYSAAPTAADSVYPTGKVTTGQPIFLHLVHDLHVGVAYRFKSMLPHSVQGTARLDAVLQSPEGWKQHIILQPPRRFNGDASISAGTLHLDRIRALITRFQTATGVSDATFTLNLSSLVELHGTVAQAPFVDRVTTPLQFQLDPIELRVVAPQTLGSGPPPSPFVATRSGSVRTATVPMRVGPLGSRVSSLRLAALLGFVFALLAGFATSLPLLRSRLSDPAGRDEPEALFRDRLVRITATHLALDDTAIFIEVPDARGLMHLADELARPILYDLERDAYLVESDTFLYRYQAADRNLFPAAVQVAPAPNPTLRVDLAQAPHDARFSLPAVSDAHA